MKTLNSYKGLIGYVENTGLISKIIRRFTKSIYSHMTLGYNRYFIIEATTPKINLFRIEDRYKDLSKITWFRVKGRSSKAINNSVDSMLNNYYDKPYSTKQLAGFVWVKLIKFTFGIMVKNPFETGKDELICAELLMYYLRDDLAIEEFKAYTSDDYRIIQQSYELMKNNPQLFEEVKVVAQTSPTEDMIRQNDITITRWELSD